MDNYYFYFQVFATRFPNSFLEHQHQHQPHQIKQFFNKNLANLNQNYPTSTSTVYQFFFFFFTMNSILLRVLRTIHHYIKRKIIFYSKALSLSLICDSLSFPTNLALHKTGAQFMGFAIHSKGCSNHQLVQKFLLVYFQGQMWWIDTN